jgi:transcription elongation GreA/GreB family factor
MSRAFVKDDDEAPDEPLPERPVSDHPNYVTPSGLARLEARRTELEAERLELARRADTDDSARDRLRHVERDLRYYGRRLKTALTVDPKSQRADVVGFGATVTVREGSGEQRSYTIVGEDEADPDAGLVSWVSPLARVLEGARVGDHAIWRRPMGWLELIVVEIGYETPAHEAG